MKASIYGTRSDLLPRSLTADDAVAQGIWTLNWAQSRAVEAESINRFGHLSGDKLDWTGVPILDSIVYDDEPGAVRELSKLISRRAGAGSDVVVLWGSLALPSVRLPVRVVDRHLAGIVDVGPQFWIYLPAERYLVECLPDGRITGGAVPDDRSTAGPA